MGVLKKGKPLEWKDSLPHSQYVRTHGVLQFVATWNRLKDIDHDRLFYGDEIEYGLLQVDHANRTVKLSLRGEEVMKSLRIREQQLRGIRGCSWHQEYGSWMLEGTPASPYSGFTSSLLHVEQNMRLRRARVLGAIAPDEVAPTMVCFPLMGTTNFVYPPAAQVAPSPASCSSQVPDSCINSHPRFSTLTANIRQRRGGKVDIRAPLFHDSETPEFKGEPASKRRRTQQGENGNSCHDEEPTIKMDCMVYGMGCCCLQVTFQGSNVDESRYLYDQMAPLCPIMLALTAATPFFRGRIAGTDVRWNVIRDSVDDRTPTERGLTPEDASGNGACCESTKPDSRMAGGGTRRLMKSRYDSISAYIHPRAHRSEAISKYYNDVECEVDEELQALIVKEGIDPPVARHVAHLFTRDPLVVFAGHVEEVDDVSATDHFENINSTNWNTMRWKPPPPAVPGSPHIGWRTEFRPMEVQLTDFENAAFTAFVVLVSRAILVFDLELLAPLSKVDDNMRRAHAMNAASEGKFWFRKHLCPESEAPQAEEAGENESVEEMTMDEIMNGKSNYFPGLIPLCYAYLEHIRCDPLSFPRIHHYLTFVRNRAMGKLKTPAVWMRDFVRNHKDYKQDSVVTQSIAYDLIKACDAIGRGERACPELHGDVVIDPVMKEGVYQTALDSTQMGVEERRALLRRYCSRACPADGPGSLPSSQIKRDQSYRQRHVPQDAQTKKEEC